MPRGFVDVLRCVVRFVLDEREQDDFDDYEERCLLDARGRAGACERSVRCIICVCICRVGNSRTTTVEI